MIGTSSGMSCGSLKCAKCGRDLSPYPALKYGYNNLYPVCGTCRQELIGPQFCWPPPPGFMSNEDTSRSYFLEGITATDTSRPIKIRNT